MYQSGSQSLKTSKTNFISKTNSPAVEGALLGTNGALVGIVEVGEKVGKAVGEIQFCESYIFIVQTLSSRRPLLHAIDLDKATGFIIMVPEGEYTVFEDLW